MAPNNNTVGKWTIITTCITLILLCALLAPHLHKFHALLGQLGPTERFEEAATSAASTGSTPSIESKAPSASIGNSRVFQSHRDSLIQEMILNLYFYGMYPGLPKAVKDDITNLYTGIKDRFRMQMSSFDVLCQNVEVKNTTAKARLADTCNKFYIDLFSQREKALYPSFDATYTEVLDNAMHQENSFFTINNNMYQITKNFFTPRYVKYDYDTTHNLVRARFFTNEGVTHPTYVILSTPFAIEYEQYGIFNIVYDINPNHNIMNFYSSDADNTERALYITPTPTKDAQNNLLNYLEGNYSLSQVATTLGTSSQYKQLKVFYTDYVKQGVNTSEYNAMTIQLSKNSKGSMAINYIGNKTSLVNATTITFEDKKLSITVDVTDYTEFLKPINDTLLAETTKSFDIFITLAFNTITIYVMYKKQAFEHHLLYKRTNLIQNDKENPYMKLFAFEPSLVSPSGYVNGHNNTFSIMQYIPNMLRISQVLGYSFRA